MATQQQVPSTSRRQRPLLVLAIFAGVVAIVGALDLTLFERFETPLFSERKEKRAKRQIVIVTLTAKTYNMHGRPLPRRLHAMVIRRITQAGAKRIAFDLYFDEPTPQDKYLKAAAQESGRVYWAGYFENEDEISSDRKWKPPNTELLSGGRGWGFTNTVVVPGEIRVGFDQIKARIVDSRKVVSAFSVTVAGLIPEKIREAEDRYGNIPIQYFGKSNKPFFEERTFDQVYAGTVDSALLRDKIVLIGDDTKTSPTPVGLLPGVTVQAHALATLLQLDLHPAPRSTNLAALCLLAGLTAIPAALLEWQWTVLFWLLLLSGFFRFNAWMFYEHGVSMHLIAPSLATTQIMVAVFMHDAYAAGQKQQTRRALERKFNPYVAGKAVPEQMFFGREDSLGRLLSTLHNNCIYLHGERRIGKSSFQHELARRLRAKEDPDFLFAPIFVDIQGVPEQQLWSVLQAAMEQQVHAGKRGGPPEVASESVVRKAQPLSDFELETELSDLLDQLQADTSKKVRLVFLVDEADTLNSYRLETNQALRRLFIGGPVSGNLVCVLSGYALRLDWRGEGSPPFNYLVPIELTRFREQEARELILEPVRTFYSYEPAATDRILQASEYRPFVLQLLCQEALNHALNDQRSIVTAVDVETVEEATLRAAHTALQLGTTGQKLPTDLLEAYSRIADLEQQLADLKASGAANVQG